MITAYIAVFEDGKQIDTLYPAKWFFRKHENETRRPRSRSGARFAEDLYIVLARRRSTSATQTATPADRRQPAGQLDLARLRHAGVRHRHRAAAGAGLLVRAREAAGRSGGATTALSLLLACWCSAARRCRRSRGCRRRRRTSEHRRRRTTRATSSRSSCSTRSSAPAAPAATRRSPSAARTRARRRTRCAASSRRSSIEGKIARRDHPARSSTKYGSQEMLGAPIDKGFNRLAWLFPYLRRRRRRGRGRLRGRALVAQARRRRAEPPAADRSGARRAPRR